MESLSPASGSVFSLLPPDNATGNFTKIVQRLPVRIAVPAAVAAQRLLRPGMSVVVSVDTKPAHVQRGRPDVGRGCRQHGGHSQAFMVSRGAHHDSIMTMPSAPISFSDAIPPRRLFAFLAMCFGMFMAFLDIQIVSSSLNDIQAGLSASADEIPWVQTAYLIAEVVAIPLSGFLSRALGTRILFATSAAGFTLASIMCGTTSSIDSMIVWRALQGFIGGGMVPTVFASAYVDLPGTEAEIHRAGGRPHRHAGADHRTDGRRLSDRCLFVALAVLRQRHSRHRGHRHDVSLGRFRSGRILRC